MQDVIRLGLFLRPSDSDLPRALEICQAQGVYVSETPGEPLDVIMTKFLKPWLHPLWPKEWQISSSRKGANVPIVLLPHVSKLKLRTWTADSNYQKLGFVSIIKNNNDAKRKDDERPMFSTSLFQAAEQQEPSPGGSGAMPMISSTIGGCHCPLCDRPCDNESILEQHLQEHCVLEYVC